ncbi:hypothetical protein AVEN_259507-1, partial [Araneus ventricosus]
MFTRSVRITALRGHTTLNTPTPKPSVTGHATSTLVGRISAGCCSERKEKAVERVYIRELENDLQKLSKYITESEIAENVLKQMKNQLEKNRMANVFLLQAVQREHEQLLQQERDAQQAADARENATPQGESMLSELKQVRFLEDENLRPEKPSAQESEVLKMKADFEKIKETTGVSDIQEAENRFLVRILRRDCRRD